MSALQRCILVLACCSACSFAQLGTVYELKNAINIQDTEDVRLPADFEFGENEYYEWEGYDGWFNNPAHPEWGGSGKLNC